MSADQTGDRPGAPPVAGSPVTLVLRLRRDRGGKPVGEIGPSGTSEMMDISGWVELIAAVDALMTRAESSPPGEIASSG